MMILVPISYLAQESDKESAPITWNTRSNKQDMDKRINLVFTKLLFGLVMPWVPSLRSECTRWHYY